MSVGVKVPLDAARLVAAELCASMTPHCERISVAGSIRRGKPMVGDSEIVYIPRLALGAGDLFQPASVVDAWLETLLKNGYLAKRRNVHGSATWGPSIKHALHTYSDIPVDLFATTLEGWWNTLVIRTGSKDLVLRLTTGAQKLGRSLLASGAGVRETGGRIILPTSEQHVFELCGVPYLEPEDRS